MHIDRVNKAHAEKDWQEYHALKAQWFEFVDMFVSNEQRTMWVQLAEQRAEARGLGSF